MSGTRDTTLQLGGVAETGALAAAVAARSNIFKLTAAAEAAVLRPEDSGRWPHSLRAALAARVATLNGEKALAAHFAVDAQTHAHLADPSEDGRSDGLAPVLAFMDKVAVETRHVAATDIAALQAAGVSDADIVRLCELNAFLAFQIRVIAGLRLMSGAGA